MEEQNESNSVTIKVIENESNLSEFVQSKSETKHQTESNAFITVSKEDACNVNEKILEIIRQLSKLKNLGNKRFNFLGSKILIATFCLLYFSIMIG